MIYVILERGGQQDESGIERKQTHTIIFDKIIFTKDTSQARGILAGSIKFAHASKDKQTRGGESVWF